MLNRVHHGHDPESGLLAVAAGSQTVGVWLVGPQIARSDSAESAPSTGGRTADFELSTARSALRGMAFVAPRVVVTCHATGALAAWRLPDFDASDANSEDAEAELLWELKLDVEPCIFAAGGDFTDADFCLALGGKQGEVVLVVPDGHAEPEVRVAEDAHKNDLTALAFSPDGKRLASAGRDRLIKVWDTASLDGSIDEALDEALCLEGCEAWPLCLAFSRAGAHLVSGCMDNGVYLWDVSESTDAAAGKRLVAVAFEHHGWVVDVAWAPDDAFVAAASWDNTIGLYAADTLAARYSYEYHRDYVSHLYFSPETPHLVSASYDQNVGFWNWEDARLEQFATAHTDWILGLTPLDETRFVTVSSDKTARIWRTDDFRCVDLLGQSVSGGFELGADAFGTGPSADDDADTNLGVRFERPSDAERAVREVHNSGEPGAKTPMVILDEAVADDTADAPKDVLDDIEPAEEEASEAALDVEIDDEIYVEIDDEIDDALADGGQEIEEDAPALDQLDEALADDGDDEDEEEDPVEQFDEALADDQDEDEGDSSELSDFLESAPDDLGLDVVSSSSETSGEEEDSSDIAFEGDAATQMLDQSKVQEALADDREEEPEPESDSGDQLSEPEPDPEPDNPSLKNRLKASLGKLKKRTAGHATAAKDSAPLGRETTESHLDLGLESEVFSDFGDLLEPSTSHKPPSSLDSGREETTPAQHDADLTAEREIRVEQAPDDEQTPDDEQACASEAPGSAIVDEDDEEDWVPAAYGNQTQLGMPSEAKDDLDLADERVPHSLAARSGTLTGAQPLRAPSDYDEPDEPDESDDAYAGETFDTLSRGESTAAREVTLADEFRTPTQDDDSTRQISGEHLGILRKGRFESGKSGRLSPGDSDDSNLEIPEVAKMGENASQAKEGPEVIETDFRDLWDRRSAASAPGMGIIKRPLAADTPFKLVREFDTPHRWVYGCDVYPKTKLVASCGGDDTVAVWGFDGTLKHQFGVRGEGLNDVVFTPDGTMVLAGGDDSFVHAWLIPQKTLAKAEVVRHAQLSGHESWISSLAISRNGKVVLSGSFDGSARAWHLQDGELGAVLNGHSGPVSGVDFGAKGLLTVGHDGSLRVWNPAGLQIDQLDGFGKILSLDHSKAGYVWTTADGRVSVSDDAGTRELVAHRGEATVAAIVKDGAIASGGKDGDVRLYVPGASQPFQTLELATPVWALQRIDDYLAVGTDDGKLRLYKRGK